MISIIIPAFNRAHVISRTLDSVLRQTYSDWECIVVDDGSTDNTCDIINNYTKLNNNIHYILNTRTKGAQGARNEGILNATGDWILLFDSDDYMLPTYLEEVTKRMIDNPSIIVCHGQMINEENGEYLDIMDSIQEGSIHDALLKGRCYVTFQASLIKKESLLRIGLLDEKCTSHQELDTHNRLSKYYQYKLVPKVLWYYYVGRSGTISTDRHKHITGQIYITKKYYLEYRIKAYRSFIKRIQNLWDYTESIPDQKLLLRANLLLLAPELPIIMLRKKLR